MFYPGYASKIMDSARRLAVASLSKAVNMRVLGILAIHSIHPTQITPSWDWRCSPTPAPSDDSRYTMERRNSPGMMCVQTGWWAPRHKQSSKHQQSQLSTPPPPTKDNHTLCHRMCIPTMTILPLAMRLSKSWWLDTRKTCIWKTRKSRWWLYLTLR